MKRSLVKTSKSQRKRIKHQTDKMSSECLFFKMVPLEIIEYMVMLCDFKSMAKLSQTCHLFNTIIHDERTTQAHFGIVCPGVILDEPNPWNNLQLLNNYETNPDYPILEKIYKTKTLRKHYFVSTDLFYFDRKWGKKRFYRIILMIHGYAKGKLNVAYRVGTRMGVVGFDSPEKAYEFIYKSAIKKAHSRIDNVKLNAKKLNAEKELVHEKYQNITLGAVLEHCKEKFAFL
jgi:hypothetical protein